MCTFDGHSHGDRQPPASDLRHWGKLRPLFSEFLSGGHPCLTQPHGPHGNEKSHDIHWTPPINGSFGGKIIYKSINYTIIYMYIVYIYIGHIWAYIKYIYIYSIHMILMDFPLPYWSILDFQIFGDVSPVATETRRLSMSSTRPGQTHRGSQQRSHRNISVERGQLTAALSTKVFKFRVRQAVCGLVGPLPFGHSPHTGHSSSSQLLPSQYIQTSAKGLPMPPTCPARRATYWPELKWMTCK